MSLRHGVLGLLAHGPASGYDLLKEFEASLANVWPATQSQLYTELGRLTEAGLIEVTAEGPRGRKEYTITESGRAELRHWLTETEPEVNRRNEALLRVFFLDLVEPEQARAFLDRRAEKSEENLQYLLKLRERVAQQHESLAVYGLLSLEWGLRFFEMNRDWARWAAGRLPGAAGADAGQATEQAEAGEGPDAKDAEGVTAKE